MQKKQKGADAVSHPLFVYLLHLCVFFFGEELCGLKVLRNILGLSVDPDVRMVISNLKNVFILVCRKFAYDSYSDLQILIKVWNIEERKESLASAFEGNLGI